MKLTNLVIGFVIFSMVLSLMFASADNILDKNDIVLQDGTDFGALAGDYEGLSEQMSDKASTTRDVSDATKLGKTDKDDTDVSILKGAVAGGGLSLNLITNFEGIVSNATADVNQEGGTGVLIDPRIRNGILAIIVITVIFAIIHYLRGFKTET